MEQFCFLLDKRIKMSKIMQKKGGEKNIINKDYKTKIEGGKK